MLIRGVTLTPGLRHWLERAGDGALLRVTHSPIPGRQRFEILHADGAELSAREQIEVRALLAAHAAEPLEVPAAKSDTTPLRSWYRGTR